LNSLLWANAEMEPVNSVKNNTLVAKSRIEKLPYRVRPLMQYARAEAEVRFLKNGTTGNFMTCEHSASPGRSILLTT
jgi:hypothetical protein